MDSTGGYDVTGGYALEREMSEETLLNGQGDINMIIENTRCTHLVHEVNICSEEYKFGCGSGDYISITELVCGSRSSCGHNVNKTLFGLCQGHQTCSSLNIGQILASQCRQNVSGDVFLQVKFTCLPGAATLCRANICTNSSQGLACPAGSLVHIRGLNCGSVTSKCSLSTYTGIYYACEGVNRCEAPGLKSLLSSNCQNEIEWKRSVIVQYFCVPAPNASPPAPICPWIPVEANDLGRVCNHSGITTRCAWPGLKYSVTKANLIVNSCTPGKSVTMDRHFGVIRSPSAHPTTPKKATSCRWHITPAGFSRIKVIVHLISTKTTQDGCDLRFLSLATVDCSNGTVVTSWYCQTNSSGTEIVSCGDVWIRSSSPQGKETSDKFIVTYQRYNTLDTSTAPEGLPNCIAPPAISHSITTAHPSKYTLVSTNVPQHPSPKLMSVGRNYGPGDGIFEYRDSLYDEEAGGTSNREDNNILSTQLRLMILYIFFGVVTLVLVVALVAVIVSYHRISRFKGHGADSSERTALCQHNEDTPMDTFLNHNLVASSRTRGTASKEAADCQTGQIVATVHLEATSDRLAAGPKCSSGSSTATFMTEKTHGDITDKTTSLLQSSASPSAAHNKHKSHQKPESSSNENCDYIKTRGAGNYNMPSCSHDSVYEMMDFNISTNVYMDSVSKVLHSSELEVPSDESHEDKLYEVANYDSSVVGHLPRQTHDLHYHVSMEDYTVASGTGHSAKASHTASAGDNLPKLYSTPIDNGPSVDLCPTMGSFSKQPQPQPGGGTRWPDPSM